MTKKQEANLLLYIIRDSVNDLDRFSVENGDIYNEEVDKFKSIIKSAEIKIIK